MQSQHGSTNFNNTAGQQRSPVNAGPPPGGVRGPPGSAAISGPGGIARVTNMAGMARQAVANNRSMSPGSRNQPPGMTGGTTASMQSRPMNSPGSPQNVGLRQGVPPGSATQNSGMGAPSGVQNLASAARGLQQQSGMNRPALNRGLTLGDSPSTTGPPQQQQQQSGMNRTNMPVSPQAGSRPMATGGMNLNSAVRGVMNSQQQQQSGLNRTTNVPGSPQASMNRPMVGPPGVNGQQQQQFGMNRTTNMPGSPQASMNRPMVGGAPQQPGGYQRQGMTGQSAPGAPLDRAEVGTHFY